MSEIRSFLPVAVGENCPRARFYWAALWIHKDNVPHTLHQCRHLLCGQSRRCRLWPCWTWQRRSQSLLQCSTVYRCLHLHTKHTNTQQQGCISKKGFCWGATELYWFTKVLLWVSVATVLQPVTHTVCTVPAETEVEKMGTDYERTHGYSRGATGLFCTSDQLSQTSLYSRLWLK